MNSWNVKSIGASVLDSPELAARLRQSGFTVRYPTVNDARPSRRVHFIVSHESRSAVTLFCVKYPIASKFVFEPCMNG